ncbi:MAG: Class II abasic (AP) endonuclease [Bogoriella megaspora]|nr:MAG: Class II abasic (AP) endonuclease [Bogoriella megaspora]
MRITTWNVNGIRNPFGYQPWRDQRTFQGMFDVLEADIVVMQELKIQRKDLRDDMVLIPGWDCYFSLPKLKKGYSGVAIYTRQSACNPIRAEEGVIGVLSPPNSTEKYCELPSEQQIGGYLSEEQISNLIPASVTDESKKIDAAALDAEGRCVILEFPAFVLFGVYSPANSNGLRNDFRYAFLTALDTRIRNLNAMGKRVILTGDLNVSRSPLDTANSEEDMRKEEITFDEYISTPNRRIFNQLVEGGPVAGDRDPGRDEPVLWDICREFHPTRRGMYTHWEQKINARPGNYGSRIDFILCSRSMKTWFSDSNIQEGLMGSDHCPVYAIFKDQVEIDGNSLSLLDIMNPPGMFEEGKRKRTPSAKDVPATCGRFLPEFKNRQSIKSMFTRKPSLPKAPSSNEFDSSAQGGLQPESQKENNHDPTPNFNASQAMKNEERTEDSSLLPESTWKALDTRSLSPEKKRQAPTASPAKPPKRTKSTADSTPSVTLKKGQQSLKGFFKSTVAASPPKDTLAERALEHATGLSDQLKPIENHSPSNPIQTRSRDSQSDEAAGGPPLCNPSTPTSTQASSVPDQNERQNATESPPFVDPIVSKESWSRLFAKPVAPRCESHGEPCIRLQSKKKGFNLGREFWLCPRPLGPTGNKERGTQWRCPTFIWASDLQGSGSGSAAAGEEQGAEL